MVKGVASVVAILGTALYVFPGKHVGFVRARIGLTDLRYKRLDKLIKKERWRKASAIELELAFEQAFRFSLRADVIRHVFARADILTQVAHLRRCRLMIKARSDERGLIPAKARVRSFRHAAVIAVALATLPFLALMLVNAVVDPHAHKGAMGCALGFVYVWSIFWGWIAGSFESAHCVTALADELFPIDHAAGESSFRKTSEGAAALPSDAHVSP
jgi:hypothetical protein